MIVPVYPDDRAETSHFVTTAEPVLLRGLRRHPPRLEGQRQPDYLENFDDTTLFFGVVESGGKLLAYGPPLFNLADELRASSIRVGGAEIKSMSVSDRNRAVLVELESDVREGQIEFLGDRLSIEAGVVAQAHHGRFAGRRVLTTLSKNNNLEWIADWARFYHINHGVDAIVLYDNASTDYSCSDISRVLSEVPGIEVSAVVGWPFKYGPQGGVWAGGADVPWDSDYCQIGAFADARFRFLGMSQGVVNADIDELIISEQGISIFEALGDEGIVSVGGHWIESAREAALDGVSSPRFWDYLWTAAPPRLCNSKWVADVRELPNSLHLMAHDVRGTPNPVASGFHLAHFKPISTSWKIERSATEFFDPGHHRADVPLMTSLARAFPERLHSDTAIRVLGLERDYLLARRSSETRLEVMKEVVESTVSGIKGFLEAWIWRNRAVVAEFDFDGLRVAFDLYDGTDGSLVATPRSVGKLEELGLRLHEIGYSRSPMHSGYLVRSFRDCSGAVPRGVRAGRTIEQIARDIRRGA